MRSVRCCKLLISERHSSPRTFQLLLLGSLVGDRRHAREILGKDDLIVIIGIEHAEYSVEQSGVLEEHRRLELPADEK